MKQDIFNTTSMLIPESFVRLGMETEELNRYIEHMFSKKKKVLIYMYRGTRHVFMGDNFLIEETKKP